MVSSIKNDKSYLVQEAEQQIKRLLSLVNENTPTNIWVESHIMSAKLYFKLYLKEKNKRYFVKAISTLLKIKQLLPPLDLKIADLKLPVSVQKSFMEVYDHIEYQQLDDDSDGSSDEEAVVKPEVRGRQSTMQAKQFGLNNSSGNSGMVRANKARNSFDQKSEENKNSEAEIYSFKSSIPHCSLS